MMWEGRKSSMQFGNRDNSGHLAEKFEILNEGGKVQLGVSGKQQGAHQPGQEMSRK